MDLTPRSPDAVAAALARASRDGLTVDPRGGGTKSRRGLPGSAGTVLSTAGLTRVVDHAPGDMTLTVEAGLPVAEVAALTARDGQWWPQAEERPGATVGGVLAAAASARGRLRHGPVRDSLLEVVLATGDGRLVKGGGPNGSARRPGGPSTTWACPSRARARSRTAATSPAVATATRHVPTPAQAS